MAAWLRFSSVPSSGLFCGKPVFDPLQFVAISLIAHAFRLSWRAYLVVQTPNDVLVDKLGLDIPPAPEVTLEELSSREVHISWNQGDAPNPIHKNAVEVNGIRIGETKRTETAVSILNLVPGTLYEIRVFAVSAANFDTPSSLLHVRTSPNSEATLRDESDDGYPLLRAYAPKPPAFLNPLSAPTMARELSGSQSQPRRGFTGRKQCQANLGPEALAPPLDDVPRSAEDEADGNLAQLSERFQKLQQDNDAAEKQILEEEREFESSLKEMETQRDKLKQNLKERDEASNDLKKQVHKLESQHRTALSEKSKKARLLQQEQNQRNKRKDEIAAWKHQISSMLDDIESIETQKAEIKEKTQTELEQLRRKIEDEQKEVRLLDEENKDKAAQVKMLEEERKRLNQDDETDESREADRQDKERDRRWEKRADILNQTYAHLLRTREQERHPYNVARERLSWYESLRRSNSNGPFAPVAALDMDAVRRGVKPRRPRQRSSLTSNMSSPMGAFSTQHPYSNGSFEPSSHVSPTYPNPLFNVSNGMTFMAPSDSHVPAAEHIDNFTGGGPMSPRADSLLPANLLGDESADDQAGDEVEMPTRPTVPEPDSTPFPAMRPPSLLAGAARRSSSPVSSSSRSFSSPQESFTNMMLDPDRRSIRSGNPLVDQTSTDDNPQSASRKLVSGLFSFNRQRGKSMVNEAPMLGSLKQGQSQSFPRNLGDGIDPLTQRRRRLSGGVNWAAPMTNLFPRNFANGDESKEAGPPRIPSSRLGFPNLFSSGKQPSSAPTFGKRSSSSAGYDPFSPSNEPVDPSTMGPVRGDTSSPRPSSTYSFDKLPRPSTENQFWAWGPQERSTLRGSPLGPDWGSFKSVSRSQSRRQSIQYGSASNLSLGPPPGEDFLDDEEEIQRPLQAPIGTRRPVTPKLNPAAPSFTFFGKRSEKGKEKAKAKEIDTAKDKPSTDLIAEDASPPDSRKSKDGRFNATASLAESRESLERTMSGTPSDTTPAKETFIQKITRKSSSNKFNSWKDKGGLFSRKGGEASAPTGEVADDVEGASTGEPQLGKRTESTSTTPNGEKQEKDKGSRTSLSWSFMRGKPKRNAKDDLATSEVSESSERASEGGDLDLDM